MLPVTGSGGQTLATVGSGSGSGQTESAAAQMWPFAAGQAFMPRFNYSGNLEFQPGIRASPLQTQQLGLGGQAEWNLGMLAAMNAFSRNGANLNSDSIDQQQHQQQQHQPQGTDSGDDGQNSSQ